MIMIFFSPLFFTLALPFTTSTVFPENIKGPNEGKLWAVLVAGSSGFDNYRHQADVCHAYQVLKNHGVPDERIIVMMYDDIAYNEENQSPGFIFNHPNGSDVYKGVPHDYIGKVGVTPGNFMSVLKGDKESVKKKGSGKVLMSGPNDHVFIYFSDHGAPGLVGFPNGELTASELSDTIDYMREYEKYGKMVIYIEACESGSMFKNKLPKDINVYATTAANSKESSYACYYDETLQTYLGDWYSVNWLEDSDKEILSQETLLKQYRIVKKETNSSHVQEFGDLSIAHMRVSEFQGRKKSEAIVLPKPKELNIVNSRDVPIEIIKRKYKKSNSVEEGAQHLKTLNKMLRNRMFLAEKVKRIVTEVIQDKKNETEILEKHDELKDFECYDNIRKVFNEECFQLSKNEYALGHMYVLVNLCERKIPQERIIMAMGRVCDHPPVYGIV